MRARLTVVGAMAALSVAGCGSDDVTTSDLQGGRGTGPAYSFALPDGWKALDPGDKADRELAAKINERVKGFDLAGFGFRYWAKPDDDEHRPIVNVVAEPLTEDTTDAIAEQSGRAILDRLGPSIADAPLPSPGTVAGQKPIQAVRYTVEGRANRAVALRHGPYVYTLTVSMVAKYAKDVDALTESIARSWRWAPLDAAGRRDLEALRDLKGDGYSVRLPLGWRGSGKSALKASGGVLAGADSLWRGTILPGNATNAIVLISPQDTGDLDATVKAVEAAERKLAHASGGAYEIRRITRGEDTTLGGDPAATLQISARAGASTPFLDQREVIARHGGRTYRVILTTFADRSPEDRKLFDSALTTWKWSA